MDTLLMNVDAWEAPIEFQTIINGFDLTRYVGRKVTKKEWRKATDIKKGTELTGGSGLYLLLNVRKELLYIGWSIRLSERVGSHFRGSGNTHYFSKEIHSAILIFSIDMFRGDHPDCRDIEHYLIDKLKPKYNKKKGLGTAYNTPRQILIKAKREIREGIESSLRIFEEKTGQKVKSINIEFYD